jgi:hypothetical protein
MHTNSKMMIALSALMMTAACSGTQSTTIAEMNQYDKHMTCTELQLEITEASFLRDKAESNRGFSIKHVVMPLSYPSTYMSADKAVESTSNRIEYLSRLSEIKGCSGDQQQQYASAAPMMQGGYAPQPMQYAPQPAYGQPPQQGGYQQMQYAAQPQQGYGQPQGYGAQPQYQTRPSYSY